MRVISRVERELQHAQWKFYDDWVGLLSELANSLFASPEVGTSVRRSTKIALKWQCLGSAIAEAFSAAWWPAIGLPSAAELTELRAEIVALRDELAANRGLEQFVCRYKNQDYITHVSQGVIENVIDNSDH